jgi:hypothetical protein
VAAAAAAAFSAAGAATEDHHEVEETEVGDNLVLKIWQQWSLCQREIQKVSEKVTRCKASEKNW